MLSVLNLNYNAIPCNGNDRVYVAVPDIKSAHFCKSGSQKKRYLCTSMAFVRALYTESGFASSHEISCFSTWFIIWSLYGVNQFFHRAMLFNLMDDPTKHIFLENLFNLRTVHFQMPCSFRSFPRAYFSSDGIAVF